MKDPAHHPHPVQRKLIREARREEREKKRALERREKLEEVAPRQELIEWIPLREPMLRGPAHRVRPNK